MACTGARPVARKSFPSGTREEAQERRVCRCDAADAQNGGMTEEEVARFALHLREAERILAMMA